MSALRATRDAVDTALAALKWPVAIACAALLPVVAMGAWNAFGDIGDLNVVWPFSSGAVGYAILWYLFFRRPGFGSLVSTFEHELTHAIFAWLTLHRVIGLKATWKSGGAVRFHGKGNWLITIAPYWFPTASVIAAVVLALVPSSARLWTLVALGVTVGYHITSTFHETHREQTDLQRVGFVFALLFLPTANIVAYSLLVLAVAEPNGLSLYLNACSDAARSLVSAGG